MCERRTLHPNNIMEPIITYHLLKLVSVDGTRSGRVDYIGAVRISEGVPGLTITEEIVGNAVAEGVIAEGGKYLALKANEAGQIARDTPAITLDVGLRLLGA